ncbi:hypothetical protein LJK88_12510 [Paenibacillus sp. P26]|nr:hypothetical protein LJK88_12510 [Paenibacillus sp. P26]
MYTPSKRGLRLMGKLAMSAGLLLGGGLGIPGGIPGLIAEAAVPKQDTVRVALFIDTGKYSAPASSVTLSAEAGLAIGMREAAGVKPVLSVCGAGAGPRICGRLSGAAAGDGRRRRGEGACTEADGRRG